MTLNKDQYFRLNPEIAKPVPTDENNTEILENLIQLGKEFGENLIQDMLNEMLKKIK